MEEVIAVVGVLKKDNRVLLSTRPDGKSHAGSWEFPGGKIEPNEKVPAAVVRELVEEIGVLVDDVDCKDLTYFLHEYKDKKVHLHVMIVEKWAGEPVGYEGQELFWQDLAKKCEQKPLLPTTQKILDLLTI